MAIRLGQVIDPWSDVPARNKIIFYNPDRGFVTGLMPEQLGFSYSNNYSAPFADILANFNTGFVVGQELATKDKQANYSGTLKELTTQRWSGGSPLGTSISLMYVARLSALTDVKRPVEALKDMSIGTIGAQASVSFVGRTYTGTVVNPPPKVQISFGRLFVIRRAIIKDISWKYSNVVDAFGNSTSAVVDLGIETEEIFLSDENASFLAGEDTNVGRST